MTNMMVRLMARAFTTMPLEPADCAGHRAHDIELALRQVPGVTRAIVNQAMEMAYVEYDMARCNERFLLQAISKQSGTQQFSTCDTYVDTIPNCVVLDGRAPVEDRAREAWKRDAWKRQAKRVAAFVSVGTGSVMAVLGTGGVFFPQMPGLGRVWELLLIGGEASSVVGIAVGIDEGFVGGWLGASIGVWAAATLSTVRTGPRQGGDVREHARSHS